jgi:hypothetical protein
MGFGLKLFRLLALLACVSLVVAGGNWVHHAHAHADHAHKLAHPDLPDHANTNNSVHDDVPRDSLIHCGSEHVWFAQTWIPSQDPAVTALDEPEHAMATPAHLQVEKPSPRLIVL